ncbi:MAG: LPXTG cell wall anchor domain-containing protein [Clostridia bacterium]|nr:LPXTG cell wall anchor domain-containing protein [Clostridia bacterium]
MIGLNMHGYMINRNAINHGNPLEASDSSGNGSIILLNEEAMLVINGSSDGDAPQIRAGNIVRYDLWEYNTSATGNLIVGALITGGATDSDYGGAFTLKKKAKLVMNDVTVAGNVADTYMKSYGTGGAIYLERGKEAEVELTNCSLIHNFAKQGGGAISADNSSKCKITLTNSRISHNFTDGKGGGIFLENDTAGATITLEDSAFVFNSAKEGGGIYVGSTENVIEGGQISRNKASSTGGGVFIRQEDCAIRNCSIEQNQATDKGAGVWVDNSNIVYTPKLYLDGVVKIKGNTLYNGQKSNLHLADSGTMGRMAYLASVPGGGSEVWVRVDSTSNRVLTYTDGSYNDSIFHSDLAAEGSSTPTVFWGQDPNNTKEFRHLVHGKGTKYDGTLNPITQMQLSPHQASPRTATTGQVAMDPYRWYYVDRDNTDVGIYGYWHVYRGYGRGDINLTRLGMYFYSDGYFFEKPERYSEQLATMSIRLAISAFNSGKFYDSGNVYIDYLNQFGNVKQLLADIGCDDEKTYIRDSYLYKPETNSIGVAIGQKALKGNVYKNGTAIEGEDTGYVLIPIAVRGAGYESEWASNVTMGSDYTTEHNGFRDAADKVLGDVEAYIDLHGLREKVNSGKIRFWVVGYSRAGATSNLVAKSLVDKYAGLGNAVYGYHFEAPQGGIASKDTGNYSSLHNIINKGDVVPRAAMHELGFQRYGVDHFIPGSGSRTPYAYTRSHSNQLTPAGTPQATFRADNDDYPVGSADYTAVKNVMRQQLAATDPTLHFDDYFHLATFNLKETLFGKGYTKKVGRNDIQLSDWLDDFTFRAATWLENGSRDTRNLYVANYSQSALARVFELMNHDMLGNLKDQFVDSILSVKGFAGIGSFLLGYIAYGSDIISKQDAMSTILMETVKVDRNLMSQSDIGALGRVAVGLLDGDLTNVRNYPDKNDIYKVNGSYINDYLVQFGTMWANVDLIAQNHTPDYIYAWLRAQDYYYYTEPDRASVDQTYYYYYDAPKWDVKIPYLTATVVDRNGARTPVKLTNGGVLEFNPNNGEKVEDVQLHLEHENMGGAIYYDDGKPLPAGKPARAQMDNSYSGPEKLFYHHIDVDDKGANIIANTMWYGTFSDTASFSIVPVTSQYEVYVRTSDETTARLVGRYNAGDKVSLPVPSKQYHSVAVKWDTDKAPVEQAIPDLQVKDNNASFTMINGNVYLLFEFTQFKCPAPTPSHPSGAIYDRDFDATFTAGEGFKVDCSFEDGKGAIAAGSGTTAATVFLSGELGRVVTWTGTAQTTREGWLPSDEVTYTYTIDYSQRYFSVETINCNRLTESPAGAEFDWFHPGDTVEIEVPIPAGYVFDYNNFVTEPKNLQLNQKSSTAGSKIYTFTMPYDHVRITANVVGQTKYDLTVVNGKPVDADGNLLPDATPTADGYIVKVYAGQLVSIQARDLAKDTAGNETEFFFGWTGTNYAELNDRGSMLASVRMPSDTRLQGGVTVTANFADKYPVTVENGTAYNPDGSVAVYALPDDCITFVPDPNDAARLFDHWTTETDPSVPLSTEQEGKYLYVSMPHAKLHGKAHFSYVLNVINGCAYNDQDQLIKSALPGTDVTLQVAPELLTDNTFDHWGRRRYPAAEGTDYTDTTTDLVYTFTMPGNAVEAKAFLNQNKCAVPAADKATGTTYAVDTDFTFTSGTGFKVEYYAVNDTNPNVLTGSASNAVALRLTGEQDKAVTWTVTVKTTRSGWLDSDEVTFTYTIDYRLQEYTVTAVNCTLVTVSDIGQNKFHPGKTITVTVPVPLSQQLQQWQTSPAGLPLNDITPAGSTDKTVTFTMPYSDVTIEPVIVPAPRYPIAVTNGTAHNAGGQAVTTAYAGERITLKPVSNNAKRTYDHWELSPDIPDAQAVGNTIELTMPAQTLTAKAVFRYSVQVMRGTAHDSSGSFIDSALPGTVITLRPDSKLLEDYVLAYWVVRMDTAMPKAMTLLASASASVPVSGTGDTILPGDSFTMPEGPVIAEPVFRKPLPLTGDSAAPLLWMLGLVLSGTALLVMRKRRKG